MNKWLKFASCNKFSPVQLPVHYAGRENPSPNLYDKKYIESVVNQQKNVSFGNIPIAERYVKRIIENSPTLPKFQFTWNFSLLFNYFHNMLEIQALDINPEAGHVDGKYLRWSEGANHL